MLIVVRLVVVQDPPQMGLVPDEDAVQELAAASPDPAFSDRVHAGRPDVAKHGPDANIGEDRAERSGEVRPAVADHELDPVSLFAEVDEQVAGLLGGPLPGGMQGDPEDPDAPRPVLDHGQDPGLGAVEQAGREESRARIASAWERRNCGPVGRRPGPVPLALRISHTVDAAMLTPRPASSPWILRSPHSGFSRASRRIRALMFRRVAGRPVLPCADLAAHRRRTMSRCQRTNVSGVTSSRRPLRRAFGITPSRAASRARSAQFSRGRRGRRRCRTVS
jgi:hypothetical protein